MDEQSAAAATNSSALVSACACVLAVLCEAIALGLGGMGRQLFELLAFLIAAGGVALGFSAFTVGRLGGPRKALGLVALFGNAIVLVVVLVLAVL